MTLAASNDALKAAIERYREVSKELADLYVSRSLVAMAETEARIHAYDNAVLTGGNTTSARHAADMASGPLTRDVQQHTGKIEAYLVELRYLDQLINYLK